MFRKGLLFVCCFGCHKKGPSLMDGWMNEFDISSAQTTNSKQLVIRLRFISWKKTPNNAVTPQRQSQFTPKMKANAVPRLLSSLMWIDQYNECNGMTSFVEFMAREHSWKEICLTFSSLEDDESLLDFLGVILGKCLFLSVPGVAIPPLQVIFGYILWETVRATVLLARSFLSCSTFKKIY